MINTRTGQLMASAILALLLVCGTFGFFHWKEEERRAADPEPPREVRAPRETPATKPIPVILPELVPPDEEPAPFTLPPGQVNGPGSPGS